MEAKFVGRCMACDTSINVGDEITVAGVRGPWIHKECNLLIDTDTERRGKWDGTSIDEMGY